MHARLIVHIFFIIKCSTHERIWLTDGMHQHQYNQLPLGFEGDKISVFPPEIKVSTPSPCISAEQRQSYFSLHFVKVATYLFFSQVVYWMEDRLSIDCAPSSRFHSLAKKEETSKKITRSPFHWGGIWSNFFSMYSFHFRCKGVGREGRSTLEYSEKPGRWSFSQ